MKPKITLIETMEEYVNYLKDENNKYLHKDRSLRHVKPYIDGDYLIGYDSDGAVYLLDKQTKEVVKQIELDSFTLFERDTNRPDMGEKIFEAVKKEHFAKGLPICYMIGDTIVDEYSDGRIVEQIETEKGFIDGKILREGEK